MRYPTRDSLARPRACPAPTIAAHSVFVCAAAESGFDWMVSSVRRARRPTTTAPRRDHLGRLASVVLVLVPLHRGMERLASQLDTPSRDAGSNEEVNRQRAKNAKNLGNSSWRPWRLGG